MWNFVKVVEERRWSGKYGFKKKKGLGERFNDGKFNNSVGDTVRTNFILVSKDSNEQ